MRQNKRARKKKPISKIDANDEIGQDDHWAAKRVEWTALSGELMEYNRWSITNSRPKEDQWDQWETNGRPMQDYRSP